MNGRRFSGMRLTVLLGLLVIICCCATSAAWAAGGVVRYAAGELLIQPKAGVSEEKIKAIFHSHHAATEEELEAIRVKQIRVPEQALESVKAALENNPHFNFVEYNYIAEAGFEPNDYYYQSQWHLPKISAPLAWDLASGSADVPIAVIDSGVDPVHPDLAAKLIPGYNCIQENSDTHDVLGHGTAVAGTASAASNNVEGVAGVAWEATVMPLVVLNADNWATYSDIAQAITYAADHHVRVMNISIGGSSSSSTLQNAVNYAWSKGAVIVACAQNYATSAPYYPAACDHVLAISATTSSDILASFSNYGSWIDVAAPGTSILTTRNGGSYGSWNGTSFSSPITAGIAALILSANPLLTNAQVVEIITQSADDLGTAGFDSWYGHGRVNACAAITAAMESSPQQDILPPQVSIVSPQNGATVSGPVTVVVEALDDTAVDRVELCLGATLLGASTSAPYNFLWNTANFPDGAHGAYAVAYDSSGNQSQSDSITVLVNNSIIADTQPPDVSILEPADDTKISSKVRITVCASDNVGVTRVELFIDGSLKASASSSTLQYTWNTRKEFSGMHTISSKAFDGAGNMWTDSVTVYK